MARPRNLPDAAAVRALLDGHGRLAIRVTPNAGQDAILLPQPGDAEPLLHVRVTATPEDGKANAAVIALLAKALGVAKSSLAIQQGQTGRRKIVALDGPG